MTSLEISRPQPFVADVIRRRAGVAKSAPAIVSAARRTYDDLAAVLIPIIGHAGVDALTARALQLVKRHYPVNPGRKDSLLDPFALWPRRHDPAVVLAAATGILSIFAGLLASLIGEPLTTRYVREAWCDGVPDHRKSEKVDQWNNSG